MIRTLYILTVLLLCSCIKKQSTKKIDNFDSVNYVVSFWTGYPIDKKLLPKEIYEPKNQAIGEVLTLSNEKPITEYSKGFTLRLFYSGWNNLMIKIENKKDKFGNEYLDIKSRLLNFNTATYFGKHIRDSIRGEIFSSQDRRILAYKNQFNLKDSILFKIKKLSLLKMTTIEKVDGDDGYTLFLELIIDGKYKSIYRWTPEALKHDDDKRFLDFCRYIVTIPNLYLDKIGYKY